MDSVLLTSWSSLRGNVCSVCDTHPLSASEPLTLQSSFLFCFVLLSFFVWGEGEGSWGLFDLRYWLIVSMWWSELLPLYSSFSEGVYSVYDTGSSPAYDEVISDSSIDMNVIIFIFNKNSMQLLHSLHFKLNQQLLLYWILIMFGGRGRGAGVCSIYDTDWS